jgi:tetratricopeptide (TPR) repeat protein/KaiC/GvpD/RAD55 family RecA-like ATPase
MVRLKAGVLAEPVLVGRERELEELESFLNSTVEGKGKTIFVSGEAGSGKTRLTREFLNAARKRGIAVMSGWCLSDAAAPYFPFVEAFHAYFLSFSENEEPASLQQSGTPLGVAGTAQMVGGERGITAWLSGPTPLEKQGRTEAVSPQVWKDQVYAGVAGTLHTISVQSPVILFIEDIHWADSASLALLHYIARAVENAEKILVLATFRSEELTADAEGHPHPLAETLRMMRREDLFTEIKLQSLSQTNVAEIAKNMIGGSLQPTLAEKLAAESRGNPLFIVESLRMLHERRSLIQEDNQWRLAVDELGVPSKIRDIILRRLAVLKYAQRRVLDAASVIGEKFDVELLSIVLGLDSLEILETLNMIAHSTSLVCVEENGYRFDHSKSRETLYEELSAPLKRGYHSRIAEKLESTGKNGKLPYSDLAYHYAQAGNSVKAIKYALAAGQDALERYSNAEAIKHYAYVLQAFSNVPENAQVRRQALEGLGDAYYANGNFEDAIKAFDDLANSETGIARLRAYRKEMEVVFYKELSPNRLMELVKKAEAYAALDRLESAYIAHNRGRALLLMGDLSGSLREHEEALRVFKEEYHLQKTADLLLGTGANHIYLGLHDKASGEMLLGMNLFHELGDARGEMEVACRGLGDFYFGVGLFQEAARYYTYAFQIGEKIGAYDDMASAWDYLGAIELVSGNIEVSLSHSLKALEYSEKTDAEGTRLRLYGVLAVRYSILGDLTHAEEYFNKLMKTPKENNVYYTAVVVLVEAVLLSAKGMWKEAEEHFKKMEMMPQLSSVGWQIFIRTCYALILGRQGKTEEAKSQLAEIQRLNGEAQKLFAHVDVQANLMAKKAVAVGEEFEMRLDLVNVARTSGLITKIEGIIPTEFKVTSLPIFCSVQDNSIEMKEKTINPFQVVTIKLNLKATKSGNYSLNPNVIYVNDLGENKSYKPEPVTINVCVAQPTFETLPHRVTTGYSELDRILLGGIPENHAVVLSSPSVDERALLIAKFLENGATAGEITVYVTVDAGSTKALAEGHPSNFFLLVCNPQADAIVQNLPNVFKLKGIESLTEVDIALTKMFRILNPQAVGPRRICIEIVSDALLQHHAVNTRRWLSALIPTLKSKGFTILAVINPQMHPPEENQAIISLFDGEIEITQKENAKGLAKILRVKKLVNQRYLDEELTLTKEKLSA